MIHVEVSEVIPAVPAVVYAVIRDYTKSHAAILPKPYFTSMTVEAGGIGAGTVARAEMNVMGAKRSFRMKVDEPEPGRVIREVDETNGVYTTFTIEPVEGDQSRVTITTDSRPAAGFQGFMEKLFNPPIMRRIYREELKLLADYVRTHQRVLWERSA